MVPQKAGHGGVGATRKKVSMKEVKFQFGLSQRQLESGIS